MSQLDSFVLKNISALLLFTCFVASTTLNAQSPYIISGSSTNLVNGSGYYTIQNPGNASGSITSTVWSVLPTNSASVTPQGNAAASIQFTTATTYVITAYVTNSFNQSYTTPEFSVIVSNPPPNAPDDPTIASKTCGSANLEITKPTSVPTNVEWYWQGTNQNGVSVAKKWDESYLVSHVGSATYYIRAKNTSTNVWSTSSGNKVVTLNTNTASPTAVAGNNILCAGNSTFIQASGVSGAIYRWYDENDNYLNFEGTNFGTGNLSESKTFKVSATVNYCESPKVSVPITVTSSPTVYSLSGPTEVCTGSTVQIVLSDSQLGKNYQLFKDGTPEDIKQGTDNSLTWQVGIGAYEVFASNSNGSCATVPMNGEIIILPSIPDDVEITAGGGANNICAGTQVTLAVNNGVGTHSWNTGQTGSVIPVNPPVGTTTYTVTVNDSCGNSQTKNITLNVLPELGTVSITSSISQRCMGSGSTDFDAIASNATAYAWSILPVNAATSINSTTGEITWNENYTGTAVVEVIASNSCESNNLTTQVAVTSLITYYKDIDRDGYSDGVFDACTNPDTVQYVGLSEIIGSNDCDDNNDNINPATIWHLNADGDLHAAINGDFIGCIPPNSTDYTYDDLPLNDCDDNDNQVLGQEKWYVDVDHDDYPESAIYELACESPGSQYANGLEGYAIDCDDNDPAVQILSWHLDTDNDGLGELTTESKKQCSMPTDGRNWVDNTNDACPGINDPANLCGYTGGISLNPSGPNYVYSRTYQSEKNTPNGFFTQDNAVIQNINYYDDLGRPLQQVAIDHSPSEDGSANDIISHMAYDGYGRQVKDWLPIPDLDPTNTLGSYRSFDLEQKARNYYNENYGDDFVGLLEEEVNAYSEKKFEPSPLSRTLKQAAPGKDWKLNGTGDDHAIEFEYMANSTTDNVRRFIVETTFVDNSYVPTLNFEIDVQSNPIEYYSENELYKTITKDENHSGSIKNHTVEEFTNKQGRVVLKRTYADITAIDLNEDGDYDEIGERPAQTQAPHDTYYVYDDFGNLTYVLPPKMEGGTATLTELNTNMNELGYQYVYDHRNRLVEKRIPGKGWESILYNKRDQPIMTQDTNQKLNDEWLFTKYDVFGRVAYTGVVTDNRNRANIQTDDIDVLTTSSWVKQWTTDKNSEFSDNVTIYYGNGAYPTSTISEVLTINYYDVYVDKPLGIPATVNLLGSTAINTTNVKGLATGSKVKVLDVTAPDVWINTVTYYDDKARPVYTYSKNGYLETVDILESQLDFIGKPLKTKTTHTRFGTTIVTIDNFIYDKVGRLVTQTQCIGDASMEDSCPEGTITDTSTVLPLSGTINTPQVHHKSIVATNAVLTDGAHLSIDPSSNGSGSSQELIVFNEYDQLGMLKNKKVGGTTNVATNGTITAAGLQQIDYTYTIRGWLKGINNNNLINPNELVILGTDDLFGFQINYNDPHNFDIDENPEALFNGNISQTLWKTTSENAGPPINPVSERYSYTYDALNRILNAADNTGHYGLSEVNYDKMGNILALQRYGHLIESPQQEADFGIMDELIYTYGLGNKLTKVKDAILGTSGKGEFKDSAIDAQDYWYDTNGNMVKDLNKGIVGLSNSNGITYNHLNLPTKIEVNGSESGTIEYIYDATGVKLQKNVLKNGVETPTDYAGNYIYENGGLQFFNQPEGYATPDGSGGYDYVYNYVDHLGNVRLSYTDANGDGDITTNEIVKESNYYPFGLSHKGYNNNVNPLGNSVAKKYMFGGKEYQDEINLAWYDVTARNYDPALGRWMNLDPLSEFMFTQSPYNYAFNNPIYFIDSDGLSPFGGSNHITGYYNDGAGNVVYDPKINSQKDLDALGIAGASYIGDIYYDSSSNTYYDENGVAHENYERTEADITKFRWSFSLWFNNSNVEGSAVDKIGSGFVLRGEGNSNKSNNKSNNPDKDIEIPAEVVAALRGITGKYKGVAFKNGVKVFQNGFKDTKKVLRVVDKLDDMLNGIGTYSNSTIDSQNYTISETVEYVINIWKDGQAQGGAGPVGAKDSTRMKREALNGTLFPGVEVDSASAEKVNN